MGAAQDTRPGTRFGGRRFPRIGIDRHEIAVARRIAAKRILHRDDLDGLSGRELGTELGCCGLGGLCVGSPQCEGNVAQCLACEVATAQWQ